MATTKLSPVTITKIRRLRNSSAGNPRYRLLGYAPTSDPDQPLVVGSWLTSTDSMAGYEVTSQMENRSDVKATDPDFRPVALFMNEKCAVVHIEFVKTS